ncbi:carnitine O-palmitoyltransferase 1 [Wickerhamomyces ciferrii]|uniref:Carnitine O-palmitoyltransferase 1 n=1 Tax=Wickerhamomyces ciferrii (strain ATCC 14091 / BCRC 22168 / CBS 111 / JCM 3599 / NBRC 0793 / NRRL Y-1031 F-60-10) TaxID=1206466 RepID=K0KV07_WICCF|nr:carnitine O-palmitoyltransferase 1 [Wickerhamomyces ciferrii]CCH44993.1 carnitine O-palmitoyltransferase 1 [Wickerhamomyces ciferrii]
MVNTMPSKTTPNTPQYLSNKTFQKEASLPNLPVPPLNETLKQLKESLLPLLNKEELIQLDKKIEAFKKSPISSVSQNHLLKFHQNEDCYLDHLNLDHILIDHKALPRNPFLILENDPLKQIHWDQSQSDRAAVLTTSALKFISSLRLGTLTQDQTFASGIPLTMKPYLNLFGTTRIPEFDSIRSKTNLNSDYILILSKSQFYTLKVLNDSNELIFTNKELKKILEDLLEEIENVENPNSTAIGSITSDTYKHWKSSREYLQREFKSNLNKIDDALFVLVLDHSEPNDTNEDLAKTISVGTLNIDSSGVQTGSCTSRWYDKLQLVVTKNSVAGVIWDSFTADGTSVLRFTSDIFTDSVLRLGDGNYTLFPGVSIAKPSDAPNSSKPKPEKLDWNFAPDAETSLHLSETRLTDLICTHLTTTKTLKFGRNFAKKIGVKADSLIQVALQIAHYALYGRPISTVEPVSTRGFKNSRSELYPVQNDIITKTCQIFISDSSLETRWKSFIDSCNFHSDNLKKSSEGEGFEKHLKALQNIYLQREIFNHLTPEFGFITDELPPLLFDDIIYPLFVPDLVASNCGNPAMRLFGLTPAVANGFGIGYIIKDDVTEICLITQYRQNERFLSTLDWVLHQLQHIWKHVGKVKIPHAHELDNNLRGHRDVESISLKSDIQASVMSRSTTAGSSDEDIDIALGGYGYFDIDDLTIRSTVQSRAPTPSISAHTSSTNLKGKQFEVDQNFGRKIINERLKDSFEKHESDHSDSNSSSSNTNTSRSSGSRYDTKFDRGQVGKKVTVNDD